jgi:thiopurine S-methyltransferase
VSTTKAHEKWPRYAVEIDEEGYPVFDGLRVDDEKLLRELLGGVRRRDSSLPNSALVTSCDGEECWIDAFAAPWVARSTEKRPDGRWDWILPSGLRKAVGLGDIEVDEWNRLHAWVGPESVPALLSRPAQAAFLQSLEKPENFRPRPFRSAREAVGSEDFWREAYQKGLDGWELGRVSPVLEALGAKVSAEIGGNEAVLVPGAGRGHEARWAELRGWKVTALDFAPEAAEGFRAFYPESKLEYVRDDAFAYLAAREDGFGAIVEHAFFCALDPARRAEWIAAAHRALKPGGLYLGVFYLKSAPGGPPFGLSGWELRELVKERFEIVSWERAFRREVAGDTGPNRRGNELFAAFRRV